MFYESPNNVDRILRLGDVVRGYISPTTTIKEPFLSLDSSIYHNYSVKFEVPPFSVVLTPCCSIGEHKMICLSPLIQLKADFSKNPYFVQDFTRLNREIDPDKAVPPEDWQTMTKEEKLQRLARGKGYVEYYLFVYAPCDEFPTYPLRKQEINYYMVDFRNMQTVKCDLLKSREQTTQEEAQILESKCLQLSRQSREELRMKLSHYFGRRPTEDEIE